MTKRDADMAGPGKPAAGQRLPGGRALWEAVRKRDPGYDGRFVYAVASTGIYCRPVCPSRRPNRARVAFFAAPALAEKAGYRACRRCRPDEAGTTATDARILRAREILEARRNAVPPLGELARLVGMSPFHLNRTFKKVVGVTPREYAHARRSARLRSRLRKGDTVTEATYAAGYGSASRAHEDMKKRLGIGPDTYRRGGKGMAIEFVTVASPLGRLLVGRTAKGICAVALGESDARLERRLHREFPNAAIRRDARGLASHVREILRRLEGKAAGMSLPLDLRGTAFQMRVWEALRRIPRGSTRSYAEIASAIGRPAAVRAVARACATNRVPVVIPCHRVVRADGGLGGYALGMDRKRRLLAREGARPATRPAARPVTRRVARPATSPAVRSAKR